MTKSADSYFSPETILAWYCYPEPNGTPYYIKDLEDPKGVESIFDYCQILLGIIYPEGWRFLFKQYYFKDLYEINEKSAWFHGTKQEIFDSIVYRARTSGYDPITDTYGTFDLGIDYYETYIEFMKLRYIVAEVIIDTQEIINNALDLENPKGKDKAVMFARHLGYTKDNYQLLLDQIYNLVLDAEAIPQNEDRFGMRYQVDLEIQGVESQHLEIVRTEWLIAPNSKQARLTTLDIPKR